jgi:hypothetical protein
LEILANFPSSSKELFTTNVPGLKVVENLGALPWLMRTVGLWKEKKIEAFVVRIVQYHQILKMQLIQVVPVTLPIMKLVQYVLVWTYSFKRCFFLSERSKRKNIFYSILKSMTNMCRVMKYEPHFTAPSLCRFNPWGGKEMLHPKK